MVLFSGYRFENREGLGPFAVKKWTEVQCTVANSIGKHPTPHSENAPRFTWPEHQRFAAPSLAYFTKHDPACLRTVQRQGWQQGWKVRRVLAGRAIVTPTQILYDPRTELRTPTGA